MACSGVAEWRIRPRTGADDDAIRRVNAVNVPEIGPLDEQRLALFADAAPHFDVVDVDGVVCGLFVGLTEGISYASPNYRWFAERHERRGFATVAELAPYGTDERVAMVEKPVP